MWRWVTRGLSIGCLLAFFPSLVFAEDFIGRIDTPLEGERVSGMVVIKGFALDTVDISRVDLYVDDQFQFPANINIPRIDVIQSYPDWAGIQTKQPGFQVGFTSNRFPNGAHTIAVRAVLQDGRAIEVGRRAVVIDNSVNQPPFGSIDIPDTSGTFNASGSFPVTGWANDVDGVARIDVLADNLVLQAAAYGDPRPDVGNAFPDLPAAQFSGFVAFIDSTRLTGGIHNLTVRVTDRLGLSRIIGQRTIQVFNTTANLRPFGYLDEPLRDATLYGTCNNPPETCNVSPCRPTQVPATPNRHLTPVRGWALDLGTRSDTGRVAYVELMIDGTRVLSTDDCQFSAATGTYVNCYGIPRFDVSRYYPTYPDAPRAGYVFSLDVGRLITDYHYPVGSHTMKIRVGDQEQTFGEIPGTSGIPVFFTCQSDQQDFASLGYIDFPNKQDFVKGTVTFSGWAIDENGGVSTVEIRVDGVLAGMALYGLVRTDVAAAYPTVVNSLASGWRFNFDTTQLSDSKHRLTVEVLDNRGHRNIIGSVDFYTDNPK
ncbi:MAG: Ig-like domain-containing protein [Acidobacteriota bacterium]